jgi:hypothetical protein
MLLASKFTVQNPGENIHSNRAFPFERIPRTLNRYFHCRLADIFLQSVCI